MNRSFCFTSVLLGLVSSLSLSFCAGQVVVVPGLPGGGERTVPGKTYYLTQAALAAGNFGEAIELAKAEYKDCMKFGTSRWIDSAAAAAMLGECTYELGQFRKSIEFYDEAILQAVSQGDWLLDVRFPDRPLQPPRNGVQLWGVPPRQTVPAELPQRVSIRLGTADPTGVMQNGGVLTAPIDYPIRPQEIMRSLAISLYRRADLLGPLAKNGVAIERAANWLQRRPAPPNHFSQAWLDVCLGIVFWSQGRTDQALPLLKRGLLLETRFDHPLTPWALLTSGRILLAEGKWPEATTVFEAAAYAAAAQADARAIEEAFRWLVAASLAGEAGLPPMIPAAFDWANDRLPSFTTKLRILTAEAFAEAGNRQRAAQILSEVDSRLLSRNSGSGWCAGHAAYTTALIDYANGNRAAGDPKLAQALILARSRSTKLFQTQILTEAIVAGQSGLSDREADELFASLLADPDARLVRTDPLEALAVMSTDRTAAFEVWLRVAYTIKQTNSRGDEAWLDAAEAARRNRWLTSRALGGRRDGLLHLLASTQSVSTEAATAREKLLADLPDLTTTLAKIESLQSTLAETFQALSASDMTADTLPGDPDQWRDYATVTEQLRMRIDLLAAGRSNIPLTFPPLQPTPAIRSRLGPRQRLLSFCWTESGLVGSLEAPKQAAVWRVKQGGAVSNTLSSLAKSLCLYHPLKPVPSDRLLQTGWQEHARRLAELLFEESGVSLEKHADFDELIIVPDGPLWYLPFELLPVTVEADLADAENLRLRDVCEIRYCPTRGLAVADRRLLADRPFVAVYDNLAFRGDPPERAAETLHRITTAVDEAVGLSPTAKKIPVTLPASLADTVAVFDDLTLRSITSNQPMVATVAGRPGMLLADWLQPPAKMPRCILLMGLQTGATGGNSTTRGRPGADLFTTAMDLAAAGAETTLLSRWNVGGRVSADLGIEFLRDRQLMKPDGSLPTAAASWRRAVNLVIAEQPDFSREPRVKVSKNTVPTDARHPFFWAGFALIDCGVSPDAPTTPNAPTTPDQQATPDAEPAAAD